MEEGDWFECESCGGYEIYELGAHICTEYDNKNICSLCAYDCSCELETGLVEVEIKHAKPEEKENKGNDKTESIDSDSGQS
jgi:hypothetical protein